MSIAGNMVGSYSQMGKTFILTDSDGNEITGVVVGQEQVFTAGDNDVREGLVYAGDSGVSTGTKEILEYRTTYSSRLILPGEKYSIPLSDHNKYNYTKLQCLIAEFNSSFANSVQVVNFVIGDCLYALNSTEVVSNVSKNADDKSIDFNITNDTDKVYVIHYFTYKQEEAV